MSLTSSGWVARRFPQIFSELQTQLRNNIDPNLDVSASSVAGQLTAIFGAAIASLEDLAQAVYDSGNKDKAEGKNLDDLAALIGISRIGASQATGAVTLTGSVGITVPRNTIFSDANTKDRYLLLVDVDLIPSDCVFTDLTPTKVLPSTAYALNVNGITYTYTSSSSPSVASIIQGIEGVLAASADTSFVVRNRDNVAIEIESSDYSQYPLQVLPSTLFGFISVKAVGEIASVEEGLPSVQTGAIRIIDTPVLGLTAAYNNNPTQPGRVSETDEELRERMGQSVQIAGKATVPAIEAALKNISGVSFAKVFENISIFSDVSGRPPKSFEAVVQGGLDSAIGNTIFDTKPAGIESYGNTAVIVEDLSGNMQAVKFSRPVVQYIHMQVTYSLYDEEVFPSTGVEAIKNAIVNKGTTLGVGEDVIGKRFYGDIYSAVAGIEDLNILVGVTSSPDDLPSSYAAVAPIGETQISDFATTRISVNVL